MIDNMGARSARRFSTTITLGAAAAPEVLLGLRDRLRAWLRGQALVVQEKADVHVHRITNDGVELSISLFLATGNLAEETRFREEINCEVLAQAAALGLRVAPACVGSPAGAAGERTGAAGGSLRAA